MERFKVKPRLQWQLINSAPKDKHILVLYSFEDVARRPLSPDVVKWNGENWGNSLKPVLWADVPPMFYDRHSTYMR